MTPQIQAERGNYEAYDKIILSPHQLVLFQGVLFQISI